MEDFNYERQVTQETIADWIGLPRHQVENIIRRWGADKIEDNGGGDCFGEKKRDYHSEYEKDGVRFMKPLTIEERRLAELKGEV